MPFGGGSFEIRHAGRLSDSVLSPFACEASCLMVSVEPAEMVLSGPVQDQAALWGLVDRSYRIPSVAPGDPGNDKSAADVGPTTL